MSAPSTVALRDTVAKPLGCDTDELSPIVRPRGASRKRLDYVQACPKLGRRNASSKKNGNKNPL